ncbi:hypothetical protein F4604DRAFT_1678358 [Suillus subluteus]|nr:hypothetical protein F4604DRAFT_1678358 [Suillus subluteus]
MFTQQYPVDQEFRFECQNEQPLGPYPALDLPPPVHQYPNAELNHPYEHQLPMHQYPNAELHPPYEHQLQSLVIQSNPEPQPPHAHKPQSQQDDLAIPQGSQYDDQYVHQDITFTGYGVSQYMWWDLGAAEAPRAANTEQPGFINTLLLVPASTPAPSNVEESSESSNLEDNDQIIPMELTRTKVLSIREKTKEEGVAPTRKKCAKTIKKALKVSRIAVIGHVKYKPFETRRVKEEMVSWMSNICCLFKDYAIHTVQRDLSLCLPIDQQGAEVLHKKTLVPMLLGSLDFLHKFEYDNNSVLVCYTFEADWFVNMIIDFLFLNGLYQYVNAENFDAVFGLAGAASHNAISCFTKEMQLRLHEVCANITTNLSLVYSEVMSISMASWTSTFHRNFLWLAPELLGEPDNELPIGPSECNDIYSFGGIMLQVPTSRTPYYYLSEAAVIQCIGNGVKPSTVSQDYLSTERVVRVIRDELDSLCS